MLKLKIFDTPHSHPLKILFIREKKMKNETFLYVNVPLRWHKKVKVNKCCKIILNISSHEWIKSKNLGNILKFYLWANEK